MKNQYLLLLAFTLFSSYSATAQQIAQTISGQVLWQHDSSTVIWCLVKLREKQMIKETRITDSSGHFTFSPQTLSDSFSLQLSSWGDAFQIAHTPIILTKDNYSHDTLHYLIFVDRNSTILDSVLSKPYYNTITYYCGGLYCDDHFQAAKIFGIRFEMMSCAFNDEKSTVNNKTEKDLIIRFGPNWKHCLREESLRLFK